MLKIYRKINMYASSKKVREEGFVLEYDAKFIEPKGDVIRAFLPKDKPV